MPDNIQARLDPMQQGKPKRPYLTSLILVLIFAGIIALIALG